MDTFLPVNAEDAAEAARTMRDVELYHEGMLENLIRDARGRIYIVPQAYPSLFTPTESYPTHAPQARPEDSLDDLARVPEHYRLANKIAADLQDQSSNLILHEIALPQASADIRHTRASFVFAPATRFVLPYEEVKSVLRTCEAYAHADNDLVFVKGGKVTLMGVEVTLADLETSGSDQSSLIVLAFDYQRNLSAEDTEAMIGSTAEFKLVRDDEWNPIPSEDSYTYADDSLINHPTLGHYMVLIGRVRRPEVLQWRIGNFTYSGGF